MLELLTDKDVLISLLEASKENVDTKIGDKETDINKAVAEEWKSTEFRILEEQHRRNRNVIEEIITTAETFREEIGKFQFILSDCLYRKGIQKVQG